METFTEVKVLVEKPQYHDQKQKCLARLNDGIIDEPIVELVNALNKFPIFEKHDVYCISKLLISKEKNPDYKVIPFKKGQSV